MKLTIYQIDAFTNELFKGNPAAICPLESWLPDDVMQSIATENNLSETAFFIPADQHFENADFQLRWFTPAQEVDLCGHATLACAHVIFEILGHEYETVTFHTRSGLLIVKKSGSWLEMDFPAQAATICETPKQIIEAFGETPVECLRSEDYIVVFNDESIIHKVNPDLAKLSECDLRGVAITSRSRKYDFVTRFFAPKYGINEDPVTGSAFTQLIPYWSEKLDKLTLTARQVSTRGGEVRCRMMGERVSISGQAVTYLTGTIQLN